MSRGQRRVFQSHARQMEQHDRLVTGVLTAQSCDLRVIVYSQSHLHKPSPTSDSILCTAHVLVETCCHMKAKLPILKIAYPGAWEVLFHVELCNVLHTLAEHGIEFIYHTPCNVSSQYNLPRDFFPFGVSR